MAEALVPEVVQEPGGVSRKRKALALVIAAASDALQLAMAPAFAEGAFSPLEDALDVITAVALVLTLGFQWRLAFAFAVELMPGAALFPSWTAVVLSTLPKGGMLPKREPQKP